MLLDWLNIMRPVKKHFLVNMFFFLLIVFFFNCIKSLFIPRKDCSSTFVCFLFVFPVSFNIKSGGSYSFCLFVVEPRYKKGCFFYYPFYTVKKKNPWHLYGNPCYSKEATKFKETRSSI
ncbi:hypothetical protein EDC94DRAFT_611932 [Helicostylum pulchrum]|nr:hypothetical protein EDC94DRAFT_611932 [Helicostylum pulchrum]